MTSMSYQNDIISGNVSVNITLSEHQSRVQGSGTQRHIASGSWWPRPKRHNVTTANVTFYTYSKCVHTHHVHWLWICEPGNTQIWHQICLKSNYSAKNIYFTPGKSFKVFNTATNAKLAVNHSSNPPMLKLTDLCGFTVSWFMWSVCVLVWSTYCCTCILHGSDECNSLRRAGAYRLCPTVSEHTSHRWLVSQTEHSLVLKSRWTEVI